jgi:Spy/CpxP family protein refolding chaperone
VVLPAAAAAQRFAWWRDPATQRQLQLTSEQVARIEAMQADSLAERQALRRRLDRAEAELEEALRRGDVDDAAAQALVERVEAVRMRSNVARSLVLVRMYRVLSAGQRTQLDTLRRRPDRN